MDYSYGLISYKYIPFFDNDYHDKTGEKDVNFF